MRSHAPRDMNRTFRSPAFPAASAVALLSLALGVLSPTSHAQSADPVPASDGAAADTATASKAARLHEDTLAFRKHSTTLANPFFEGRAPGTRGNVLAAEYLEFQFKKFGLKPAFSTTREGADPVPFSSYQQPFQHGVNLKVGAAQAELMLPDAVTLTEGQDFNVLGFSGNAEATGPLVFIGYGINIGKDGYSSFPPGADLKGKIAIVLRFEPMNDAGKSQWDDEGWSWNAGLEPKIQQAASRGAAGVILVSPPGADDERVGRLETLDTTKPQGKSVEIPVVMMTIEQVDRLVKAADEQGRSLLDLRKIADDVAKVTEQGSVIDLPKAKVRLKSQIDRDPIMTSNVGAILPGAGPLADQYIIIGAHYDHVGYGFFGSRGGPESRGKIHPGADDNSSGTSGMLILAERLAADYAAMPADAPRRSIFFMGYSAEESGLNGSRYYVQNMIADKDKHAFMINLDMIGRYRGDDTREPPLEITGLGTAEALRDTVEPLFASSGLRYVTKPGGSGPSDHASFYAAGIPVLFFFTGLHEEYHAPSDTFDTLNPDGAARIVALVQRVATALATRPDNWKYLGDADSQPSGDQPQTGMGRMKVRFGIAPGDYAGNDGVMVGQVFPDTSAAEGGLQKGDRMIKWNDEALTTVESWMPMLTRHEPGDKVDIVVVRDGKEVTLNVTLKPRRGGNQ